MKNLSIGRRLVAAFTTLIVLIMMVSGLAVHRLGEQQASASFTLTHIYSHSAAAQRLSYLSMDIARIERNLILDNSDSALAANKAALEKNIAAADKLTNFLDAELRSERGRALFKALKQAQEEYRRYTHEMTQLALAKQTEEATKVLYGEKHKTQQAYVDALTRMVDFQELKMQEGHEAGQAVYSQTLWLVGCLSALATVVGIFCAVTITRSIVQPLKQAVAFAEIVASGDLTQDIKVTHHDETGQLLEAMKRMNDKLGELVSRVRSGTDSIAAASNQIASGNMDLSARTEQQAASLEETASSMEELTSTVQQNADHARQANSLAFSASDVAQKGGAVVTEVVQTMGSINDSAKKIGDIISVIDGIAFQTNILALNAAVEAARAGEQGRGFAVVASEVRTLAQRSANAAKEIKDLISNSMEKVEAGSKLVNQAGATMDEVVGAVRRVSDIIAEIAEASAEQRNGIEQVNQAVTQMDDTTQQNAALVEEAAAAANAMQEQASGLAELVSVFRVNIFAGAQTPVSTSALPAAQRSAIAAPKPSSRVRAVATSKDKEWETL
jgi:methyl-accepting chemotaxis protein